MVFVLVVDVVIVDDVVVAVVLANAAAAVVAALHKLLYFCIDIEVSDSTYFYNT